MLWLIILHEYRSSSLKLCWRWDHVILKYAVIVVLIQFALHLVQIPHFRIGKSSLHHNRASSMFYGWCDIGGCCSFTNSSLPRDPPIWLKDFNLWFISLEDFIPPLYCPVFVCLLTLFYFLNSGFLTAILPYRPTSQSLLHTVDVDPFYYNIGSVVQQCLKQSAFCHTSWWLWWNSPLHR